MWEAKDGDEVKPGQAVVAPGTITCCCDAAGGGLTFRSSRVQRFPGIALRWMSSSSPLQKQQGRMRWMRSSRAWERMGPQGCSPCAKLEPEPSPKTRLLVWCTAAARSHEQWRRRTHRASGPDGVGDSQTALSKPNISSVCNSPLDFLLKQMCSELPRFFAGRGACQCGQCRGHEGHRGPHGR